MPIATQLQIGQEVEPLLYPSATIAYIDIIGFMKLVSAISPLKATNIMKDIYG